MIENSCCGKIHGVQFTVSIRALKRGEENDMKNSLKEGDNAVCMASSQWRAPGKFERSGERKASNNNAYIPNMKLTKKKKVFTYFWK